MSDRRIGPRWVAVLVACVVLTSGVAVGYAEGSPRLDATVDDNRFVAGEETTVRVTLTNAGELESASVTNPANDQRVQTATGVSVALGSSGAPLSVTTPRQSVGNLPNGGERTIPFAVSVDEDAKPGTYTLPVRVEYRYLDAVTEATGFVREREVTETLEVTVRVVERARFAVVNASADVAPNSAGSVTLTLENVGSDVGRDATVSLESLDSGVTLGNAATASQFAGDWRRGERRTLTYAVTASEAAAGAEVPFRVTTAFDDDRGVRTEDESGVVGVRLGAGERFVVTDVSSDVASGGSGAVALTVRNDGPTANETTLTLRSDGPLGVDGATATRRVVGEWPAGATKTIRAEVTAPPDTRGGTYALDAVVGYRTGDGVRASTRATTVGVPVAGEQTFSLRAVDAALAVGEEGTVGGTLVNEGPGPVRNVAVVVSSPSSNVRLTESTYAVGELAANGTAEFSLDAVVAPTAAAGPRPFDVTVRYETAGSDARESDPIRLTAPVGDGGDRLAFEAVNATYGIDTSNRLDVRVTNVGDERLEDVRIRLGTAPPFASDSPTAFVPALEAGESTTVGFELTVSEDAVESTHAVSLNATAETADERTVRTDSSLVPVTIADPEGPGGDFVLLVAGAVFVLVVLGAGWWWLRR